MDSPRAPRIELSPSYHSVLRHADDGSTDRASSVESHDQQKSTAVGRPQLFHRVRDERSILALTVSADTLYAGTQGGEIVTWSLETWERRLRRVAHNGAVLSLSLANENQWLFSSAGDAIVNIWDADSLQRVYSIYSTYDVGDIFCVVLSMQLNTVYLGAQNTSIQWYDLSKRDSRSEPNLERHPSQRNHRFFDSKGPGGISTPRHDDALDPNAQGGELLEIDKTSIIQYAHFGYVYCMSLCKGLLNERDEEVLITGGGDGSIKLWRLNIIGNGRPEELYNLSNGDQSVLTMALNNTILYVGQSEGTISVWDLENRQMIQTFSAHRADVMTVCIAHGVVFTGGSDGKAKIFERYKCQTSWPAHENLILASAVLEQQGKLYYITGGNDNCVAAWDLTGLFKVAPISTKPSQEQLVQSLAKFVSYRTVSSRTDYAEDCRHGASWLRNLFKKFGAATQLLKLEGNYNPIVLARYRGSGASSRSLLFYGHYDVVPAESGTSQWNSDPFEMEGRDGYLYGRGVTDNKGPILAAIYAVADLMAEGGLACDVTFLIEGEEECGSRGFETAIRRHKKFIGNVDWILLANAYWLSDDVPCLNYGLRGVIHLEVRVDGGERDLHSGVNGSHLMSEPVKDLVTLLSTLTSDGGHISIPGFYDDILSTTEAEDLRYETLIKILQEHDISYDTENLKARWREPSLTIHGLTTSAPGNSTIIPHSATATLSLRLVPDQSAAKTQDMLKTVLEKRWKAMGTPNRLSVTGGHPVDPWLGDPDNQIYKVLDTAVTDVWKLGDAAQGNDAAAARKKTSPTTRKGHRKSNSASMKKPIIRQDSNSHQPRHPLYVREGGSIPAIRFLEREFNAPAAQLPCGQSSDSAHLVNERIRLLNLYNSREIFKRVFRDLPVASK